MEYIMKKTETNNRHYVDNKEFLKAITAHREAVLAAEAAGEEKPRVSNYIGECFVKIANHLAYKANFVNYTFRDEMILDGIENCITYIHNFNPEKSKNPFAYFTTVTYYAFIRRIQKEKKHLKLKQKVIMNMDFEGIFAQEHDTDANTTEYLDFLKKQIDESAHIDEKYHNESQPKKRPKYLDDKQAMELAQEKIDALKPLDNN